MLKYDKMSMYEKGDLLREYEFMKKKQHVLKAHPYKIYCTETSGWYTTIDTASGKKKIRKTTEEALIDALEKVYFGKTIKELYLKWYDFKANPNNTENMKRIERDWRAYYENEPLSQELLKKPIMSITTLELREWSKALLCKYTPDRKKFQRMFYVINQVYEYACDDDINILDKNLWQVAKKKIDRTLIRQTELPEDEEQVFTDAERRMLKILVYEDLEKNHYNPTSAGLQILLMLETGMRIGEACGLKWEDIVNGYIRIRRQADNNGVKNRTKTIKAHRDIPLTDEAKNILENVRKFNEEHGLNGEWVFQSCSTNEYDGRLSYHAADRKLAKLCDRMNTPRKSPHKCRKTFATILKNSGSVSDRAIQRFMGHRQISTTINSYVFDQRSKEEQAEEMKKALFLKTQ